MVPSLSSRQVFDSFENYGIDFRGLPIETAIRGSLPESWIPFSEFRHLKTSSKISLLGECHLAWIHQAIAIFIVATTKCKAVSKGSRFKAVEAFLNDPSSRFELVTTDINLDETTHGIKMLYDHIRKKVTKVKLSELDYSNLDTLFTWCSQLCSREEEESTDIGITIDVAINELLCRDIDYSKVAFPTYDYIAQKPFGFKECSYIKLPESREEAEAMILIANKWLEDHPQSEKSA